MPNAQKRKKDADARQMTAKAAKAAPVSIWLDDVREAPRGYVWCKSVNAAIRCIESCERAGLFIARIDCDHDLGDYAGDGGDGIRLIDWLAARQSYYPVFLHTMNPVGRQNMQREIDRYWPR